MKRLNLLVALAALGAVFLCLNAASAQYVPSHALPIGKGAGVSGFASVGPCNTGAPIVGAGVSSDPTCGKGGYTVSPELFGAVGDGTTDDIAALSAAAAYAATNDVPLCITEGKTFGISAPLVLPANMTVTCGGTIEPQTGVGTYTSSYLIEATTGDTIKDVHLDGTNMPTVVDMETSLWFSTPGAITAANFPIGSTITGSVTGATGTVLGIVDGGHRIKYTPVSGTFKGANDSGGPDVITDATTAATASVSYQSPVGDWVGEGAPVGGAIFASGTFGSHLSNIRIDGVEVKNFPNNSGEFLYIDGLEITNTRSINVQKSITNGAGRNYATAAVWELFNIGDHAFVSKNYVSGFQWKFIDIDNTSGFVVSGNYATGYNNANTGSLAGQAAYHDDGSSFGLYSDNTSVGSFGHKSFNSSDITITGFHADLPITGGVIFDGCTRCQADGVVVIDPQSAGGQGTYGLAVSSASGVNLDTVSFTNSKVYYSSSGANQPCVFISPSASNSIKNVLVQGNTLSGCDMAVQSYATPSGSIVDGIRVLDNTIERLAADYSMLITANNIDIERNKITDLNASSGIFVENVSGVAGTILRIKNNTCNQVAGSVCVAINSASRQFQFDTVDIEGNTADGGAQLLSMDYSANATDYVRSLNISGNHGYNQSNDNTIAVKVNATTANTRVKVVGNSLTTSTSAMNNIAFTNGSSIPDGVVDNNNAGILNRPGNVKPYILATTAQLGVSVSANAATFSVLNAQGNTPSASSPAYIVFRHSTASNGNTLTFPITAPMSVTTSSGSTLGAGNAVPFRVWVTAIDDAGTPRLGVVNAAISSSGAWSFFTLDQSSFYTTTAEGSAGAADSAGVIYTGTAVGTPAPMAVLGFASWDSGLATAGTWSTAPSVIQPFRAGIKLPGDVLGTWSGAYATNADLSTTIPLDDTIPQNTEGTQVISLPVVAHSPASVFRCDFHGSVAQSAASSFAVGALFYDASTDAFAAESSAYSGGANEPKSMSVEGVKLAGSAGAHTIAVRVGATSGTMRLNGTTSGRLFGGTEISRLICNEISP